MKNTLLSKRIAIVLCFVGLLGFNFFYGIHDNIAEKQYFSFDARILAYLSLALFIGMCIYLFRGKGLWDLLFSKERELDERQSRIRQVTFYKSYWLIVSLAILLNSKAVKVIPFYFLTLLIPLSILAWEGYEEIIVEEEG